jgi:hypothetical protein
MLSKISPYESRSYNNFKMYIFWVIFKLNSKFNKKRNPSTHIYVTLLFIALLHVSKHLNHLQETPKTL